MIVYNDTKQNFLTDVENDRIAFKVEELLFQKLKDIPVKVNSGHGKILCNICIRFFLIHRYHLMQV